jgi:hypothetical protein
LLEEEALPKLIQPRVYQILASAAFASLALLAAPIEKALADKPASPVTVVNPATNPAVTSSVDDPGRIAYQAQASARTDSGGCSSVFSACTFTSPVVPAGKRLVIQHVALQVSLAVPPVPSGVVVIIRNANAPEPSLLSSFVVPLIQSIASGDQAVQFYVDGGGSFVTDVDLIGGNPIGADINFTGYLLDCKVNECAAIAP